MFRLGFKALLDVIAFIGIVQALFDAITIFGIFSAIGGVIYAAILAYYTVCLKVS